MKQTECKETVWFCAELLLCVDTTVAHLLSEVPFYASVIHRSVLSGPTDKKTKKPPKHSCENGHVQGLDSK